MADCLRLWEAFLYFCQKKKKIQKNTKNISRFRWRKRKKLRVKWGRKAKLTIQPYWKGKNNPLNLTMTKKELGITVNLHHETKSKWGEIPKNPFKQIQLFWNALGKIVI